LTFIKIRISFGEAIKDEEIMHLESFIKDHGIVFYYEGPEAERSSIGMIYFCYDN